MAAEDLANYKQDTRTGKTAGEALDALNWKELASDVANEEAAAAAGVKDVGHVHYAEALEAYESRPDIESLARRRARDFPEDFDDAAFMRASGNNGGASSGV